ncbi:MAG TPA: efflux RND transporter periplasmic adaptor subunit [Moraxellaceae bacterium]|nr:efflux RND transporter periplasmic adaptor subunit [Moraxellaceae bacterium]
MPQLPASTPARVALAAAVVLAAFLVYLAGRGPELPGYRVTEGALVQRIVASGQVSSRSLARVGSEITGVVKVRHVREGDVVRPGDLLIELRDEEQVARVREAEAALAQLETARRPQAAAALQQADSALALASSERARRDELFSRQLLSAEQRDQARNAETAARTGRDQARVTLEALRSGGADERVLRERLTQARAALARTKILASLSGVVQARNVEPGDLVQPGRTLLEIARADSREIVVALDEKSLGPVRAGLAAEVEADAYPGKAVPARVSWIAPAVDPGRGTADVHLDLLAPADFLRQGMTVSVNIDAARVDKALVVPNDALHDVQGDRAVVFTLVDGRVQRKIVRLGLRSMTQSQVMSGLVAGSVVLATDAEPGSRARVRLQSLPVAETQAHGLDPSTLPVPGVN